MFANALLYRKLMNNEMTSYSHTARIGWIGSITGVSLEKVAISEIGVSFPDETFGKESRFGVPFTVLKAYPVFFKV